MTRKSTNRNTYQSGLGLVELMVALVLGLLVVGAAIGVFMSNRQTYTATESLGRVQENARVAFELMARDLREAGGNPCSSRLPIANVLENPTSTWFTNFGDGIRGVEGAFALEEPGNRVAGTDAVELMSGEGRGVTVASHNPTAAAFHLNTPDHDLVVDEVLLVCDNRQATIFQMTGPSATNATVVHNTGTGTVGNCTKALGVPVKCACTGSPTNLCNNYEYGENSQMVRLKAVRWFIGENPAGGNSLYRSVLRRGVMGPPEEITDGVEDMQISYLLPGAATYVAAGAVGTRWGEVLAARIELELEGEDRVGLNGEVIGRQLVHIATLRNRNA
ncbi:PilW family protein [Lysobacter sp. A3-1-A15]|uniref:PilW family protein n=1 Tax=Novilysobacter viscosus TaxID=3098602 RepID=UPI002EDAB97B